jgi:NDP-sugar pyrophosphorylase family protein
MTDMLFALIQQGKKLKAIPIEENWLEIDTPTDLKLAEIATQVNSNNTLSINRSILTPRVHPK